jgi:uncharacterized protein YjbI with pentapeptide repeats
MNETVRAAALEGEAPVNPYSLLEAVNTSSDSAHTAWLIFIGIMGYVLVAVAGVTHKDLLLSRDITLPLLQVHIELTRFFLFAPVVLVLFHLGVLCQLVILARKTLEFDASIRMLEATDKRTHPLRLELHNFFFVQAIAGPERGFAMSALLHLMSWATLIVLPVALLLYMQVAFLPYHDAAITWAHRIVLVADIAVLALIGVFLMRPETSFLSAVARVSRSHPVSVMLTTVVLLLVSALSFLVATVPGEALDRAGRALAGVKDGSDTAGPSSGARFVEARADAALFGLFQRNLSVTDHSLVGDKDAAPNKSTLVLRGRDLRFARLDRTDLHQADLTGASLDGASLVGADLRNVNFQCADFNQLTSAEDRGAARCVSAREANLTRARLKDARMAGIDLTGARLEEANLDGADLNSAVLIGANFSNAHLERAELAGVSAQRARFATASLQGAELTGAKLAGADFANAGLQAANLAQADLYGATLRDADMEGADLRQARLQGASLAGVRTKAADLRGALIWLTAPPDVDHVLLADLSELVPRALDEKDLAQFDRSLVLASAQVRGELTETLAPIRASGSAKPWAGAADQQAWQALGTASATGLGDNYKVRLTDHLVRLACKPRWADGAVATGVVRRALGRDFKGDMPAIHDRFKASDCPGAKLVPPRLLSRLAIAADAARGQ